MNSRILETILIDWRKLKDLQPEGIKTSENEQALRESLQKYGFVVPFYVWKDSKGVLWTIDGHTRKKVLKDMQAPEMLQATLIQAKNKKEAQEMLIEVFNQRQNGFVVEVLETFIQENELEVDIESVNVEVEEVESGGLYEEYEEANKDYQESQDDLSVESSAYTGNIKAPIYEIKGDKPNVQELANYSLYQDLIDKINKSNISKEHKFFLSLAASRHIVFNYSKIAEYYAHSEKEIQELFEDSALVIIDFNKALEMSFIQMSVDNSKLEVIKND